MTLHISYSYHFFYVYDPYFLFDFFCFSYKIKGNKVLYHHCPDILQLHKIQNFINDTFQGNSYILRGGGQGRI